MKIQYLDGFRLKRAIIAGSSLINKMQKNLNRINVFPVADGDTGTNMAYTMNYITKDLSQCSKRSISDVSLVLAESALMGAQGNSGAILAQFFNGFAEALEGKLRITTQTFAKAIKHAKDAAFDAMSDPKEGTILTVIKDWAAHIEEKCPKTTDFVEILQSALHIAKNSLMETPQKLKILATAGVVDAGAQGFVHLLEEITHFIEKGKITINLKLASEAINTPKNVKSEIKFIYCTECMLVSKTANRKQIKEQFDGLGDSLIIAHRDDRFRIHIHTNDPDLVFQKAAQYGTIERKKVDNMAAQHESIYQKDYIAVITDSSCDLPDEFLKENHVYIIPTKISFGSKTYLDKIEITPNEFYDKLIHSEYHPTTSQPSLASFKEVYEEVVQNYDEAISIHLPRVTSGTLQRAESAAEIFGQNKITCIDGKNVSVALGLVVMEAIKAIDEGDSVERIIEKINLAASHIYLFASVSTMDYMLKGGRISRPKWILTKLLNLKPVVSFNREGKAEVVGKAIGEKALMKKTLKVVKRQTRLYRKVEFMVAHANAYEKAEWYVQQLQKLFNIQQQIPIVEAAPVLGVHAGPGTAAIAFIGNL